MTGGLAEDTDVGGSVSSDGAPEATTRETDESEHSERFQQLGNETRLDVLRLLASEEPCPFSTLFENSDKESSAGFAYHLRQLSPAFIRQRDDERWELTAAGREATRTVQGEAFITSIDRGPITLDEECPVCQERELTLAVTDNVATVSCVSCPTTVLQLPVPASGDRHDETALPAALDSYHRHRIRAFDDGVCPDCGGAVETTMRAVPPETVGADDKSLSTNDDESLSANDESASADDDESASADDTAGTVTQVSFDCATCGAGIDCQVTLSLLDHPAVISFYEDHDEDIEQRPVWNVGTEWRERVLSTDPWCVLVSTRQDDERLELYVGGDGTVHESRRQPVTDETVTEIPDETESGDRGEDAAA